MLGLDQVGVEDSFFDLGGHSLLAAVLVARLAQRLGIKISLRTFMTNPSVRAIDRYLDQPRQLAAGRHATAPPGLVPARKASVKLL